MGGFGRVVGHRETNIGLGRHVKALVRTIVRNAWARRLRQKLVQLKFKISDFFLRRLNLYRFDVAAKYFGSHVPHDDSSSVALNEAKGQDAV